MEKGHYEGFDYVGGKFIDWNLDIEDDVCVIELDGELPNFCKNEIEVQLEHGLTEGELEYMIEDEDCMLPCYYTGYWKADKSQRY